MRHSGRFALALTLMVALAVAAVAWTFSRGSRDGLPVAELMRVESVAGDRATPLERQVQFLSEIFAGTRRYTDADLLTRFNPAFREQFTADDLNTLSRESGAIRFVRVLERDPQAVQLLGVADDGITGNLLVAVDDEGRIATLLLVPAGEARRLQPWQAALILLAGWVLIAGAAAAWMYRAARTAWTLLAAALPTLAGVLVLSDSSLAYAAGRMLPSLVVVFGVVLLARPGRAMPDRWLLAVAVAAAVAGMLAPLVRDASLLAHPEVLGSFADSEALYRLLLASSAGLAAAAMGGAAFLNAFELGRAAANLRPTVVIAAAIAAAWAVAAAGTALDYAFGDGTLAAGPFAAVVWAALALLPAVLVFRLIIALVAQLDEIGASRARILDASDAARRRVERDLHDGAQQRLVALGLRLQRARRLAGSEELGELLEGATREVRDTIDDIRAVTRGGLPPLLADRGLATAVDALAERAPVPVSIDITAEQLPTSTETTAYFVIAEGLTNMAKHAMATEAHVSVTQANGEACVVIRDDGKGGARIAPGSGLEGLTDRVAATGGTFRISSGPGGTKLEANIPCG